MLSTLTCWREKKKTNIQNQFQRNKLEVVKILYTEDANRKTSVLCHLIEIELSPFGIQYQGRTQGGGGSGEPPLFFKLIIFIAWLGMHV